MVPLLFAGRGALKINNQVSKSTKYVLFIIIMNKIYLVLTLWIALVHESMFVLLHIFILLSRENDSGAIF